MAAVLMTGTGITFASFISQTWNSGSTFSARASFSETLWPDGAPEIGNWVTNDAGTFVGNLSDGINDSTRVQSSNNAGTFVVTLADSIYPTVSGRSVTVAARFARTSISGTLSATVALYQGNTSIASQSCPGIQAGWATCYMTLTSAQRAAITDPDDLRVSVGWGGGALQTLACSTVYLQID